MSSFLAGASSLKMPLAQGKESLAIVHGERVNEVVLEHFGNLVILKITKNYDVLLETLKKWGFSGGMATRLGFPQEMASSDWEQFRGKKLDYFSLLLVKGGTMIYFIGAGPGRPGADSQRETSS